MNNLCSGPYNNITTFLIMNLLGLSVLMVTTSLCKAAPQTSPQITNEGDTSVCQFPFIYKEVSYTTCTAKDDPDGHLWCSTKTDDLNNHVKGNFALCSNIDNKKSVKEKDSSICQFPFIYKEVSYTACTARDDPDGQLWCSTETDELNNHIKGNYVQCNGTTVKDPPVCQFPFIYKNIEYSECTDKDDPDGKLWCSTKTDDLNNHVKGNYAPCNGTTAKDPPICQFPFIYKEVKYTECTATDDPDGKPWCSIKTDNLDNHILAKDSFAHCTDNELDVIPDQRLSVIPKEEDGCGIGLSNNVIGGEAAALGEFPWLAAIGTKNELEFAPFCGGTLITKQHVISAAHCFTKKRNGTIVRLGGHDLSTNEDGAKDFKIVDSHENYNDETKQGDIILLKLDRTLESYTDEIRAACLPYHLRNNDFEEISLIVVGWGIFNNSLGTTSPIPLKGAVPVVPIEQCKEKYKTHRSHSRSEIDESQLCAGTNGTDTCKGDSGGPINYIDTVKGQIYVVGVVSFGPRFCGSPYLPGVYTRTGYYLDWIEENIREMI